jgi:hypothetical protein
MKRLALAASLALAFIGTGLAGCDDDDNKGKADAAGDAGGDARADATAAMCTGTFASFTRATLGTNTAASGACKAPDLDVICVADIGAKARACGTSCLQSAGTLGEASLIQCVDACLQMNKDLTIGCSNCYRELVACTAKNCLSDCSDPNSNACKTCQTTKGCTPTFFTCSGLPSGAPSTDAGSDAGDARIDATPEAGADVPRDTTPEARPDASADMPSDAGADADAPVEAGADSSADAVDGGADASAG